MVHLNFNIQKNLNRAHQITLNRYLNHHITLKGHRLPYYEVQNTKETILDKKSCVIESISGKNKVIGGTG